MNLREWALPVYTIMIKLAVGALLLLWIIRILGRKKYSQDLIERFTQIPTMIILSSIVVAMVGAHFHLSRPFHSIFALSNFHTSWLSREIVFTALFFAFTGILFITVFRLNGKPLIKDILGALAIIAGLVTVYCMAMIYLLPTQLAWNAPNTLLTYFSSMLLLGSASLASILLLDFRYSEMKNDQNIDSNERKRFTKKSLIWLAMITLLSSIIVIGFSVNQIVELQQIDHQSARTSLHLLLNLYRPLLVLRFGLLFLGIIILMVSIVLLVKGRRTIEKMFSLVYFSSMLILTAEILERFLFYATHVRIGV